ncbi:rubredoxin [Methanolobus sp. ZRKC3]|uniref:rubredoxin n=1 Tax=Methanolobus sp. ZRKC3 TaxID=3125786 RepID=UPI00324A234E
MTKYTCNVCNVFEYDEDEGNADTGIEAGTKPEDFPDDWECPICGADKSHLISNYEF